MTKRFVLCMIVLATATSYGCERIGKAIARQVMQSTSPEVKAPDLKPVNEQEATQFADAMSLAIKNGDAAAIERLIDYDAIIKRALAGAHLPAQTVDETARGVVDGARQSGVTAQLARMHAQGTTVTLLSTRMQGTARRASFRTLPESGGFEHYDFLLTKRDDGAVVAADVFFMSAGEAMSTSMRRMLLGAFAVDQSFLERLNADENLFVKHLEEIKRASAAGAKGEREQALALLEALPEGLKTQKFVLLQMLQIAVQQPDDPRYAKVIGMLIEKYPDDPAAAVASIDHYFLKKDYTKALAAIDVVEKATVPDPYFGVLKVNALASMGKHDAAKNVALETIAHEPGLLPAHFALVGVLLQQKDHAGTAEELLWMRDHFKLAYNLEAVPEYATFVASREYPAFKRKLATAP